MAAVTTKPETQPHGRPPKAAAWLLIAPLMLWLAVFVVAPILFMLVYSFCIPKQPAGVTFDFSIGGYKAMLNWSLLRLLSIAGLWATAGTAVACGLLYGLGRLWTPVGDWLARRWLPFCMIIFVAVGWGVLRTIVRHDESARFIKVFVVSIDYAVWSTLICVLIGYPVAFYMGRSSERMRNILMIAIMVPFWTSFLIRTYAWLSILKGEGLLNGFLLWAKVITEPLDILYTPTAVMIGLVYTYLPFMILPIYTSCERLDQSMIDAAFDLGAGPFRAFWTVILPLTWPGVVAGVVITFVPAIGMFAVNDILGGKTEPLIGNVISNQFVGQGRNWPQGAAFGMVLMMMFVVTYYVAARKRGTVVG